ncbi:hypothetical protein N2152v2_002968 [Parachlorella kessleri]
MEMQDGKHQHLRFDEDFEDLPNTLTSETLPAAAMVTPPQYLPAGHSFQCVASLRTDLDKNDQCYVLDLVHCPATGMVAAPLSNRLVKLYNESGVEFTGDLRGHSQRITAARFDLPEEPHLLHTSSSDGTVAGWDTRSGQQVERFQASGRELFCASTTGTLVAAGGGDSILFWDRRKAQPLTSFGDTHAQDVTQVAFHPLHRHMLVSGSEDGLVAVFDTAQGLDEDEGFKAALNIDNSVARLGFYGPQASKLWVTSGTETFHLWEWAAACNDEAEGGNGALADVGNAREQLTQAASLGGAVGAALAPSVDYLIGCEYAPAADQLWLAAGNNTGVVGLFPVAEPPPALGRSEDAAPAPLGSVFAPPQAALARGHDEVVRAIVWPGGTGSVCLSGGEDSRLCMWRLLGPGQHAAAAAAQQRSGSMGSSDSVARRQGQLHSRRKSPY